MCCAHQIQSTIKSSTSQAAAVIILKVTHISNLGSQLKENEGQLGKPAEVDYFDKLFSNSS